MRPGDKLAVLAIHPSHRGRRRIICSYKHARRATGDCTEKLALYAEYWNCYRFKRTLDAVESPNEEPLIGRTPFVESNHQRKVGGWYWLTFLVYRPKIVDHSSAGISSNRLPNGASAGSL
jgi:hypothetical protein